MSRRTRPRLGLEPAQHLARTLELLGVGVALMLDQGQLADPDIGLTQDQPVLLGQPHLDLVRAVHQLGIGREGNRLGLHRGVDHHLRQFSRCLKNPSPQKYWK